ncbi:MAG: bifunctional adenosylcobinamide kinase/adenosylcobinamide-phosphate guanylyltransferase [Magnetococcus sp. DMHC-6]
MRKKNFKDLILGGARSGKSRLAQQWAEHSGLPVTLIATGQALDMEMAQRIQHHQQHRPPNWRVIEEPFFLAQALVRAAGEEQVVIVDCLTLWITNLFGQKEGMWEEERQGLFEVWPDLKGRVILVANETGLGITPLGHLTRRFVDESGRLHQELAVLCDRVVFMVAGLPLYLKGEGWRC